LFIDHVHFCYLDKKVLNEIRFFILRHSPSKGNGSILFLMQSISWAVSVPFPSKLLFSVRSCLGLLRGNNLVPSFSIAFMVLDAFTSQPFVRLLSYCTTYSAQLLGYC
ncbi:hypothetical protein ILYODFUR_023771, partial [Ilyodon furcidens]